MDARIWLENSQPADGEASSEGVHQALAGGNEFCLGRDGQRDIKAVAETAVASLRDLQRLTQQVGFAEGRGAGAIPLMAVLAVEHG